MEAESYRAAMLTVAIDAGPLYGPRSGIGHAVSWYLGALADRARGLDLEYTPYVVSMRAAIGGEQRRLPVPAAMGLRWWAHSDWPAVDRWLGRPDVVHGTNYVVPPSAAARVVSVYDCWFLDHPDEARPDVRLASAVLLRSLREGATALVSSQATAQRLRQHVDTDRIEVVHLGPPLLATEPDADGAPDGRLVSRLSGQLFILALGTLEKRKNLPHLVASFERVCSDHGECCLVIAGGDGDDRAAVEQAIMSLPSMIADRVVVAGRVTAATKRWLLSNATVLSYVSLDEGFGFPILEGQQAGVPVIASTAGSSPEIGGDGARYVDPVNAVGLAEVLVQMVTDEGERRTMIEAGNRNLTRFSWDQCVRSTVDLYRSLAGSG